MNGSKTMGGWASAVASATVLIGCLAACGNPAGAGFQSANRSTSQSPRERGGALAVLSKEEVGAILGSPVTTVEGAATDMSYKTALIGLETTIDIESGDDSVGAITGARKATGMLGGSAENVPNLGDEAFFGAMSILYVRTGDHMITITPPNLQLVAASAAYAKVTDATMGAEEQAKAMQELTRVEKTDPLLAGLQTQDAMQGALATVATVSKKQGTTYETQARTMALALAAKLLAKL